MFVSSLRLLLVVLSVGGMARAQCADMATPGLNGCGSSTPFGIPRLQCSGAPTQGNAGFGLFATNPCNAVVAVLLIGGCPAAPTTIPGPFGTGRICGPSQASCLLFVDPVGVVLVPGVAGGGGFSFSVPVPNDPRLAGVRVCAQGVELCATPCVGATQGIEITVQ